MGDRSGGDGQTLSRRIEELERERDELKKDIEQICLHQGGPGFLGVATRMHLQRIAGLEEEINNLKKKVSVYSRDNQNLQEELSEAYRMKSQLADMYRVESSKNTELEKQVKFFQGCIAAAFAERDHALMECEKAKEQKEIILQELTDSQDRVTELESTCADLWKDNTAQGIELLTIKEKILPLLKVVTKFYEIREATTGCSSHENWEDKCSCLLGDSSEMWVFDEDRESSTSKYIASLEEELHKMRNSMEHLHNKMQMGLEIEQHLKRKVQSLERKLSSWCDSIEAGLSNLHDFHSLLKIEVMNLLEEHSAQIKSMLTEVHDKLRQQERNMEENTGDIEECKDLHITNNADSEDGNKMITQERNSTFAVEASDYSYALAVALKDKVSTLLLLSQQEERHMLERDLNIALQKKMEDLQRNLFQVTHEKVQALMELADLKRKFEQQQESCSCSSKYGKNLADGKLKGFLKKTYMRHWIGKDYTGNESIVHLSDESVAIKENLPHDLARLKDETAALQESISSIEILTSSIRKLRLSLLEVKRAAASMGSTGSYPECLDDIILEATNMKTALSSSLPISWSAEAFDLAQGSENSIKLTEGISQNEKLDIASATGFEMVELLLLAADLQRENGERRQQNQSLILDSDLITKSSLKVAHC